MTMTAPSEAPGQGETAQLGPHELTIACTTYALEYPQSSVWTK